MKIEFRELSEAPSTAKDIYLGDEAIGWLRFNHLSDPKAAYHAGISMGFGPNIWESYLAQGFGSTPQEAVDDAVEKAMAFAGKVAVSARSLMGTIHSQGEHYEADNKEDGTGSQS